MLSRLMPQGFLIHNAGLLKRLFPLPLPAPKKEEKSVLPVWRSRAKPATHSLLIWVGGMLPIRATFEKL